MWHLLISLAFGDETGLDSTENQIQEVSDPFQIGVQPDGRSLLAVPVGMSFSTENGGFVGVETSLSRVNGNRLLGISGDVLWDTGLDVSATVGPRIGVFMLAMDGGIGLRSDFESPADIGAQLRFLLNVGFGQRIIVQAFTEYR